MAYGEEVKPTAQLGKAKVQDVASKPTIQEIYQQSRSASSAKITPDKKPQQFAPSPPIGRLPKVAKPSTAKDVRGAEPLAKGKAVTTKGAAKATGKPTAANGKTQVTGLHRRYLQWRKRMGRRTSPGQTAVANKPSVSTLKYGA